MEQLKDYGPILAYGVALASVSYALYTKCKLAQCGSKINHSIQKDNSKVVHSFDIEDMSTKEVFCRCWRSKKFPYCDGSHGQHNKTTGDNIGPLIIQKKHV